MNKFHFITVVDESFFNYIIIVLQWHHNINTNTLIAIIKCKNINNTHYHNIIEIVVLKPWTLKNISRCEFDLKLEEFF